MIQRRRIMGLGRRRPGYKNIKRVGVTRFRTKYNPYLQGLGAFDIMSYVPTGYVKTAQDKINEYIPQGPSLTHGTVDKEIESKNLITMAAIGVGGFALLKMMKVL